MVSVKPLKCSSRKSWLPSSAFSQQGNVMGTRNVGHFVGQEVTEGTCRHTYFRTRHLPGSRLNSLEFKESLAQDWHSEIFVPFAVQVEITLSYPGIEMLLSSPGLLLVCCPSQNGWVNLETLYFCQEISLRKATVITI